MSLIKWRPMLDPFEEMEETMKRFFPTSNISDVKSFVPAVDVYEEKEKALEEFWQWFSSKNSKTQIG